jgi:3-oxoadipate enol-lactonase
MDDTPSSHQPVTSRSIPVPAASQSGLIPVDGVGLYYELFGAGSPVVLVPGEVADSRIWNDQVAAFAERYQVVRFDLRGSGRSESGKEPFTYVGDMASMLRTLQVAPAYLVGIADGATLAVEYALEHPHKVEVLILVNTSVRGYVPETISPEDRARLAEVFSQMLEPALNPSPDVTLAERMKQFIEFGMSLPENALDRAEARERARTMATENAQRLLAEPELGHLRAHAWLEPPAFQRLAELHVPTLILVGGPMLLGAPKAVEALSRAITGAQLVLMPAESTMINLNQPEAFNGIVLDFLEASNQALNL